MDNNALSYYSAYSDDNPQSHFHKIIALHEDKDLSWKDILTLCPSLSRGWYELSHLSREDRIEFLREFWLAKLPYHPHLDEFIVKFFASLDDVGIFLTQSAYDSPFEPQCVYSLADNNGFFHGYIPAQESELVDLQRNFPDYILPVDYLAFLQIHNGFAKSTDTGILNTTDMPGTYSQFQEMLDKEEPIMTPQGIAVNPRSLIPFYKSFGMPFFQCFWGEWYPNQEMGNVYYSGLTKTISDCTKSDLSVETMAFETFMEWLIFYLEKIN